MPGNVWAHREGGMDGCWGKGTLTFPQLVPLEADFELDEEVVKEGEREGKKREQKKNKREKGKEERT